MFVHPIGHLREPVTVAIQLPAIWRHISTGLETVTGQANTFEGVTNGGLIFDGAEVFFC